VGIVPFILLFNLYNFVVKKKYYEKNINNIIKSNNSYTVFGLRESGRIDCGRKESTETNILPPFGCFDREERKCTVHGSHS
jgi:hypothetical protein